MTTNFIRIDPRFDVWVAGFGAGRNGRVTIIKTRVVTGDDPWEAVPRTRLILAGSVIPELRRLLDTIGRTRLNRRTTSPTYPHGLFSGTTYDRLRRHLQRGAPPVSS